MRRARKPTPQALSKMNYNAQHGCYQISEGGITYSMPLELTRGLKQYFSDNMSMCTVAQWYDSLNRENRKLVIRSGELPEVLSDFYPDESFE